MFMESKIINEKKMGKKWLMLCLKLFRIKKKYIPLIFTKGMHLKVPTVSKNYIPTIFMLLLANSI